MLRATLTSPDAPQRISVMMIAEAMHQAQVAPIINGSRKVRYIENSAPTNEITQVATAAYHLHPFGPYEDIAQVIKIRM